MAAKRSFISFGLSLTRRAAVSLAAIGLLFPCGCDLSQLTSGLFAGGAGSAAVRAFVGNIAQSAAILSIDTARTGGRERIRIFLTDGTTGGNTEFFEGPIAGDNFDVTSKSGNARIAG